VIIPSQVIPIRAESKPENEFEAAFYETEHETVFSKKALEKFPSGFQEKLDIEMEFNKVRTIEQPLPGCRYNGTLNSEGFAEFKNGILDAEIEEITIKNGNVGFEAPKPPEA
jgi:hypothetical protein